LVPTNTTAVAAAIAPTSSINCLITTQILNATPTGPFSYSWTPSSGLTGSSVSNPTVSVGGTYSVVITNTVNGCFGNASTTVVSNTIIPTVTISPSSFTTTCTTPTVQLTANTSTNSVNYTWTVPATGTLSNVSSSNPIASGAGIFTVVVTNTVNGCVSTAATSSITINVSVPTATLASNNLSITCVNPAPGTSVSTSTSSVNCIWTPSSGIASGANTSSPTFTLAGTYSVVITNTINGCSSNASSNTVTVTLNNTIPTISITPSQTLTCTTPSITITTTVNPSSGLSYNWTGSGVTGATTNSVSVNQAGVYSATVTNPVNGCFVTTSVAIASNTTAPIANIAVNSITTTCAAPTATLNASSTPSTGVSYNWSAPGSGSLNTFTVSNPVAGGSGIFTVTVTDNTNGCSTAVSQATVEVVPDAATPIINVSANNLTITCTNTTVTTALTSTNSIASYNWNPSPVSGGANPVFDTPGIYTATVTATNGCPTNVSVNVGIDITVPTASLSLASNNGTLTCLTTSITLTPTVSPMSNLTYTWSPSIGLASNINQASATFTAAGVYALAITNTITGCVSSLTNTANTFTVIEDNASPSFTLGTASSVTTTCASPNATLLATSDADPNSVYVWTTPTSSTVTGNPIVSSATGIYSVIVTNTINGCSTSASSQSTVEVVADSGIPNITLSSNSVSITCSNPTPSVSITTTASPVSYSWSPASGIVSGTETTANPIFTLAGTYSVIVTNTVSGCATSISSNVVNVILDNTIPVITLSSSVNDGTITCINSSVTITPSVTPNSNITYTWSPSGVFSSSINDATFSASGIYTLAITNTLTGCVNTTTNSANTFTVYLNTTTPTITTNAISSNTVIGCSNSTVSFSTNVTANGSSLTYTWSTGVNTPTIDITTAGVYSVVVTDSDNGCFASSQFTVEGNTITPQGVNAGVNTSIPCGSNSLTLTGVSTSTNVNYSWSGPSTTSILSGSNTATPVVTEVGTYTLTVTDNQTGCQSTSTVNVSQTNVTAAFTANPTSGTSPLTVTFTDASSGANNWSWNFGDTSPVQTFTSNPASLSNVYSTGTYTASLTASSGSCTSTYTVLIVVEDGLTLEIPNVFTPNSDGANDVFTINSSGVKEISLQIFNRWGQILHEFTGPKASWDGLTPNGNLAPTGTYFFFVKATGFDDKVIEKNGVLSLFR
jgi:gliding motility-associated-like protein